VEFAVCTCRRVFAVANIYHLVHSSDLPLFIAVANEQASSRNPVRYHRRKEAFDRPRASAAELPKHGREGLFENGLQATLTVPSFKSYLDFSYLIPSFSHSLAHSVLSS